jgi:uncharacterized membrane protein YwaF
MNFLKLAFLILLGWIIVVIAFVSLLIAVLFGGGSWSQLGFPLVITALVALIGLIYWINQRNRRQDIQVDDLLKRARSQDDE